jgi:antibiotic biosynthesis monooxygenase (ABM) superfamily enzyme
VIIRFDTIEHLYAWTQSETRRSWWRKLPAADGRRSDGSADRTGLLVYPAGGERAPAARWKQFLITLLVIFPAPTWCRGDRHAVASLKGACCCI